MDRETTSGWSRDLNLDSVVGLGEGASYLDRMIAGGDRSHRQFLPSGPKQRSGANQNKNTKQKNKPPNANKTPFQNKLPIVNIDHASWIADRKRKFPKMGCAESSSDNNEPDPIEIDNNSKTLASDDSHEKPSTSTNSSAAKPKRRKTLFEKLIEMDQQSTTE